MQRSEAPRKEAFLARSFNAIHSFLRRLISCLDKGVRVILGVGMALIMAAIIFHVVGRYFFGRTYMGTMELVRYTMIWVSILGASAAFATKEHVLIDMLARKLPPRTWRWFRILADLILCAFFISMILGGKTIAIRNFSQTSLGLQIPMFYPYLAIPVGGVLMLLYTLLDVFDSVAGKSTLKGY